LEFGDFEGTIADGEYGRGGSRSGTEDTTRSASGWRTTSGSLCTASDTGGNSAWSVFPAAGA